MHTPALHIPPSSTTIIVKIIDVTTIANVPAKSLFQPTVPGIQTLGPAPSFAFLLEHPSGQKVVYDLGVRKDWDNLTPAIVERLKRVGHNITVEKNVADVLDEAGVGKENINAVIWSHAHWDHTGDMSTFLPTTELVVGRDFKKHFLGDGDGNSSPLGSVLPSDTEGRNVREITFDGPQNMQIGHYAAFDYFNDGSLYLLDSPGHCVGHVCALARTTSNPDTFVFLGGDTAHHGSEFRPSTHLPLPASINLHSPAITIQAKPTPFCPGAWFEDLQTTRGQTPTGPLWQPAFGHDMAEAQVTIGKMQECDANEDVLVILAHDATFRSPEVPLFPREINDWKARGLGEMLKWEWIGDILAALKGEEAVHHSG